MGVRHYVKADRSKQYKELDALNGRSVEVGVFNGEHAWLAHIHEFGCQIPVTEKMRAYLHWTGLHIKKSTRVIVIPERSFLRGGYDASKDEVVMTSAMLVNAVAEGALSADALLEAVGTTLEGKIKEYATNLSVPPLHGYTLEHRAHGGSNPLNDTGDMIGGITHRVK